MIMEISSTEMDRMEDHEVWDLKSAISEFIFPRLQELIKRIEAGEMVAIASWVSVDDAIEDTQELEKQWVEILKKMSIPFHYHVNPAFYKKMPISILDKKRAEGLRLFAEYFEHLWD